jgi:hypothetical protein
MLLTVGIACIILGVVLNTQHILRIDKELQVRFLREANPAKWAILIHLTLIVLMIMTKSLPILGVLIFLFILEMGYFVLMQKRHLRSLPLPAAWLRRWSQIDLVFVIGMVFVVGSLVLAKVESTTG